jgi:hypothetical protein
LPAGARYEQLRRQSPFGQDKVPNRPGRDIFSHHPAGTADHLLCRPTCEREKENATGIGAAFNEAGYPGRQGLRLTGAGAGDDQERPGKVLGGLALGWVERGEPAFLAGRLFRDHGFLVTGQTRKAKQWKQS